LFQSIFRTQTVSDDLVCGRPTLQGSQYIIGGQKTVKGAWPWLVAVHQQSGDKLEFVCGGSLISNVRKVFS
jgi:secreted trypsin-like serine protease